MEKVRKTFFDPLASTKSQIQSILQDLPVGSAHPFSPGKLLLCRTETGIEEIDISSYPEDYFFNAVDLGEMGEVLLRRMQGFSSHLSMSSFPPNLFFKSLRPSEAIRPMVSVVMFSGLNRTTLSSS